jgi:CubicO group peptidase (beta-lactamase class C family)
MKAIFSRLGMAAVVGVFLVSLLPAPAQDKAPATTKISEALKPFVDNHSLAGAVTLVADRKKVLSLEAVGAADIANNRPMLIDAIFWIASMSKPITAAALMILVDEGKVNLDDPVEKYLPEFKDIRVASGKDKELQKPRHLITVREILSHTSGLPFGSPEERPTIDILPLKDAVLSYTKHPLLHEPGSKYQYSNAGINTAGRIIEVASGMSYEEFLDKRLFGPLGMTDTTFWPTEDQVKRLAKSYKPNKDKTDLEETKVSALKYPLSDRKRYPCPGGGLFSTATDCGVFCQMVLNGGMHNGKRILSESAVKEMTSRQTGKEVKENYGLGWFVGGNSFGHGGAYSTNMSVDTKRGLVLVWMVQHSGFPGNGGQSQGAFRKAAEATFSK